jgi:menaquinone-dependent protoporphyrinogen oxidase
MSKRVLVTHASRTGSTAEVAGEIGKVLAARGLAVDVRPIKEDPPAGDYQAVVIGSAVRMGNWQAEAVEYVKRHRQSLGRKPVAVFTVHALNTGDDDPSRSYRAAYLDTIRPLLKPVAEGFFAGRVDPARLCTFERLTLRAAKTPAKDFRDWEKIRGWAQALCNPLLLV